MTALRRRAVSIPALFVAAVVLSVAAPLWVPAVVIIDLVRGRVRLPLLRLGLFGVAWMWLESVGVVAAGALWLSGQARRTRPHYRLQAWWAGNLVRALRVTTGLRIDVEGEGALDPGPVVMLCRHASLADSLLSAWAITVQSRRDPRYVLKRELQSDPCLDIVGHRLPNHFVDRGAGDSSADLVAIRALGSGMGERDVAVIFPEGTRASPRKRAAALERLEARDPERAARLAGLHHLIPPRPSGAAALLDGAAGADVVLAWHVGFDGLDTFAGILDALGRGALTARFRMRRVPRVEVPGDPAGFTAWLDTEWLELDGLVGQMLEDSHS